MKYLLLAMTVALLLLAGCDVTRGANHAPAPSHRHDLGGILDHIGYWATLGGVATAGAGCLALIASAWSFCGISISDTWRKYIVEVIVLGGSSALIGALLLWLGSHVWVVYVAAGLVAAALCYRYRRVLIREIEGDEPLQMLPARPLPDERQREEMRIASLSAPDYGLGVDPRLPALDPQTGRPMQSTAADRASVG